MEAAFSRTDPDGESPLTVPSQDRVMASYQRSLAIEPRNDPRGAMIELLR